MSLLPIIYTSLILFFGLMMIVIIISYISYKIKAEKNPVIEEEKNKISIPKRIINPGQAVNVYSARMNKNVSENYQTQYINRNSSYNRGHNTRKATYNKTRNYKPRIEIMNYNPAFVNNESQSKFKDAITNNTSNLSNKSNADNFNTFDRSNLNLLNYYTDTDERLTELKVIPIARY